MHIRGKVKVLVLRTAGTNCDRETAFAFEHVGAKAELVHINRLVDKEKDILDYDIVALPGGFSYGDDIASGKILANEIRYKLLEPLKKFIRSGRVIIGICNGFQILVKSGLLPNLSGDFKHVETSLTLNDSAKFEDRWVYVTPDLGKAPKSVCIWTQDLPRVIYLPVAHAEGKFIPKNSAVLKKLSTDGCIALKYCDSDCESGQFPVNPNGSIEDIAGICDTTGRVFGLMPHPERHIQFTQHPFWTRLPKKQCNCVCRPDLGPALQKEGDGLKIFRNGVEFVKKM